MKEKVEKKDIHQELAESLLQLRTMVEISRVSHHALCGYVLFVSKVYPIPDPTPLISHTHFSVDKFYSSSPSVVKTTRDLPLFLGLLLVKSVFLLVSGAPSPFESSETFDSHRALFLTRSRVSGKS